MDNTAKPAENYSGPNNEYRSSIYLIPYRLAGSKIILLAAFTFLSVLFLTSFLPASPSHAEELKIKRAVYKKDDNKLVVKGTYKTSNRNPVIFLFDDESNQLLSQQNQNDNRSEEKEDEGEHTNEGSFEFELKNLSVVPCRVRVELDALSSEKDVEHAPSDCGGGPPVGGGPGDGNQPPVCTILSPSGNVSINVGDAINFVGEGSDPEGGELSFEWDFGGGADVRPTVAAPGDVVFDQGDGSFTVSFIVVDNQGARCVDTVRVDVGTPPAGLPPKVAEQPAPGTSGAGGQDFTVLAFNDLGMHCADLGSFPFSVLPPFNTLNAQLILKGTSGAGRPVILDGSNYELRYSAASNPTDPVGFDSLNSTSQNFPVGSKADVAVLRKTDFWDELDGFGQTIAALLFPGLNPLPDEGLQTIDNPDHGRFMPGIADPYFANDPQAFGKFKDSTSWFTAQGIPMTSVDDKGRLNSYPLMRVQGVDSSTGEIVATVDAVTPVSTEVDCRDCHTLGEVGADPNARVSGPVFIGPASQNRVDVEAAAKNNILSLHDFKHGTNFINDGKPVLCAGCHRSNALADVGGPGGVPMLDSMSKAMHGFHGRLQVDASGALIRDAGGEPILIDPGNPQPGETLLIPFGENVPMEDNCFLCHPGKITQCFRGAMFTAGLDCANCHGDMLAVGGEFQMTNGNVRDPWVDLPKCYSCHTGHGDDAVRSLAFDPNDRSASPLPYVSVRFAENPDTLYRNSLDTHAGIACEGCHGSPHAIWPNRDPNANDNVAAIQLQGHTGPVTECVVCHEQGSFPDGTLDGPHGMHPVNDPKWIRNRNGKWHKDYAENSGGGDKCADCHGADHRGTRLAKVPVDRVMVDDEGKVLATLKAGDVVSCGTCHSVEDSFED